MTSPNPNPTDSDLLARLNALRKSPISLSTAPHASITPSKPQKAQPPSADDLAARFARLGSPSPVSSPKPSRTASQEQGQEASAPVVAPGAASYLEGVAEGVGGGEEGTFNEEDERSLEELVGELGARGWDVEEKEEKDLGRLVREIRGVLPKVEGALKEGRRGGEERKGTGKKEDSSADWENVEVDVGSGRVGVSKEEHGFEGDEGDERKTEQEETDDVIAQIMAELAVDEKYGVPQGDPPGPQQVNPEDRTPPTHTDELALPSVPDSLSQTTVPSGDNQDSEDALAARFASLMASNKTSNSLSLPSVPTSAPSLNLPPTITTNRPTYTDEEMESWCIICNDDATLKCLGCDGDLYCRNCWMEGHRGESAGFEERRHKAVEFTKDSKEKKVAAAAV